jgi:hypothetical protein
MAWVLIIITLSGSVDHVQFQSEATCQAAATTLPDQLRMSASVKFAKCFPL